MKKYLNLLVFLFCIATLSFAQNQKTTNNIFLSFLDARENEFKDIKGEFVRTDSAHSTNYFACKETFGAKVEAIVYDNIHHTNRFYSYFDYSDQDDLLKSANVLTDLLNIVNKLVKEGFGTYKGKDYKTDSGQLVTELTDREGKLVMQIITAAENKSLSIIFYSSSYGKP